MSDATGALLRAVRNAFPASAAFTVEEIRSRSWSSGTFSGARHALTFRLDGDDAGAAADRFLEKLAAAEFILRGHILADIGLAGEERTPGTVRIKLEALTVEDG